MSPRKLKRQTRNPRLLKVREKLIRIAIEEDELLIAEVAEIFRTTPSNISQTLNKGRINKTNNN